jgi:hypothetical protein
MGRVCSRSRGLLLLLAPVVVMQAQPDWPSVKNLAPGIEIRVTTMDGRKVGGGLRSVTDEALVVATPKFAETLNRAAIVRIATRGKSHRGRNALIGLGIGAGGGLVAGAVFDHGCPSSGCAFLGKNAGKEVLTPVGAIIGVVVGALIPTGGWHDVYRAK